MPDPERAIDAEKMRNVLLRHLEVDKNGSMFDFGTGPELSL